MFSKNWLFIYVNIWHIRSIFLSTACFYLAAALKKQPPTFFSSFLSIKPPLMGMFLMRVVGVSRLMNLYLKSFSKESKHCQLKWRKFRMLICSAFKLAYRDLFKGHMQLKNKLKRITEVPKDKWNYFKKLFEVCICKCYNALSHKKKSISKFLTIESSAWKIWSTKRIKYFFMKQKRKHASTKYLTIKFSLIQNRNKYKVLCNAVDCFMP